MACRWAPYWIVLLILTIAQPVSAIEAQAGVDRAPDWAEAEVSGSERSDFFGVTTEVGESVGGDPLVDCQITASMEAWEITWTLGARGVNEGLDQVVRGAADDALFAFMWCVGDDGGSDWFVWEHGDPVPDRLGEALARSARARVEVPLFEPTSAPDGFDVPYLTQLPVWLWIDDAGWATQRSTAAIEVFGISATVEATPVASTWAVDGVTVAQCGRGTVWAPGLDDADSTCSVTFTDTAEMTLSVVVSYDVTLTCVPASMCDGLTLDPIHGSAERPVRVVEAWGVVTS